MLPIKVLQLDYQDFASLVWTHLEDIENFEDTHQIKFDGVIGKLRNGVVPASIVATYMNLPMGVLNAPRQVTYEDYEAFLTSQLREKLKNSQSINLLYVDSICGTGNTIKQMKKYFEVHYGNSVNVYSYCTLVDVRATTKPDILGLVHTKFFQPPWEWRAFTPQTHLDRLEVNDIKASPEDQYYIGFSSDNCKNKFELELGQKLVGEWINIFNLVDVNRKIQASSGITSLEIPTNGLSIEDARTKFAPLIEEKTKFIESNGFTHFIEDDWSQAVLISRKCPVCHILYFDGKELHKIYAKKIEKEDLISLNF